MTCDECLAALETGNFWQRRAARRHAAGCPACAEAVAALARFKQHLAEAPPISAVERQRWMSAAGDTTAPVRPRWTVGYAAIAATGAVALVALGAWLVGPERDAGGPVPKQAANVVAQSAPRAVTIEADPDLRDQLLELSDQVDRIAREAALLDEGREVRLLWNQPQPEGS